MYQKLSPSASFFDTVEMDEFLGNCFYGRRRFLFIIC